MRGHGKTLKYLHDRFQFLEGTRLFAISQGNTAELESAELAIYGDKESLKRTSTAAEPSNADVGRKVHYLTNFS